MARTNTAITEQKKSLLDDYVFMDKTFTALEVAMKTQKNLILYGPGGYGKSEYSLEYLYEKGISPYVITMGKGITADRLFGGLNVKEYDKSGKIEYLVENSFMNHEYVIFEEMMDAPDYILEQLKDILSSGFFRNGSQYFKLKTKLIIGCTNKSREEFSKNNSLKALMERFPLEQEVIWDSYADIAYNTLLEKRYGAGNVDPIMPFLLQEYSKSGITISPRIALDAYDVFDTVGPDNLLLIADFAKKPSIINDGLTKFEDVIRFKTLGGEIQDLALRLEVISTKALEDKKFFVKEYVALHTKVKLIKTMTITDDLVQEHTALVKMGEKVISDLRDKYTSCNSKVFNDEDVDLPKKAKSKKSPILDNIVDRPF